MKKLVVALLTIFCIIWAGRSNKDCYANEKLVSIFVNCDGGSCHTSDGYDLIDGENIGEVGNTVSSVWEFDDNPTAIDKDFIGWYIYEKETGKRIDGTGLLTTEQVNNYIIPDYVINIVAQWTPREGYPVTNNAFFVFWNAQGEPCYDVKVSIIHDGICYSGYGFVSIPEYIYSTWSKTVTYRFEPSNGVYTMYDGKWTNEAYEYDGTAREFKNVRMRNSYISANTTGKGSDKTSPRNKVNDWFYQASFVEPEVSVIKKEAAGTVIADSDIIPDNYTVETQVYQSGVSYDAALQAAKASCGTDNVVVVDISLKDEHGAKVTQLSDYVDVRVDIPTAYTIQQGNTVVVYYLNEEGILEECETVYHEEDSDNRYVTFKTNHFSVYVLAESKVEPEIVPEIVPEPEESGEEAETDFTEDSEAENKETTEEAEADSTGNSEAEAEETTEEAETDFMEDSEAENEETTEEAEADSTGNSEAKAEETTEKPEADSTGDSEAENEETTEEQETDFTKDFEVESEETTEETDKKAEKDKAQQTEEVGNDNAEEIFEGHINENETSEEKGSNLVKCLVIGIACLVLVAIFVVLRVSFKKNR